jgi:hypothetical protein
MDDGHMAAAAVALALLAALAATLMVAVGVCRRLLPRRYQQRIWAEFSTRHRELDRDLENVWERR